MYETKNKVEEHLISVLPNNYFQVSATEVGIRTVLVHV